MTWRALDSKRASFDGVDAAVDLVENGEDVVDQVIDEGIDRVIDAAPEQGSGVRSRRLRSVHKR